MSRIAKSFLVCLLCAEAYSQTTASSSYVAAISNPQACTTFAKQPAKDADKLLSLSQSICLAQQAIEQARSLIASQNAEIVAKNDKKPLRPTLSKAEFDFQTVATVDTSGTLSLWIITIGGGKTKAATSEVDFTYSEPEHKGESPELVESGKQLANKPDAVSQVASTIVQASNSIAANPAFFCLTKPEATVIVAYAVTKTGNLELAATIGSFLGTPLVGPDAKASKSSQSTQTIKLTLTGTPPTSKPEECPNF